MPSEEADPLGPQTPLAHSPPLEGAGAPWKRRQPAMSFVRAAPTPKETQMHYGCLSGAAEVSSGRAGALQSQAAGTFL